MFEKKKRDLGFGEKIPDLEDRILVLKRETLGLKKETSGPTHSPVWIPQRQGRQGGWAVSSQESLKA